MLLPTFPGSLLGLSAPPTTTPAPVARVWLRYLPMSPRRTHFFTGGGGGGSWVDFQPAFFRVGYLSGAVRFKVRYLRKRLGYHCTSSIYCPLHFPDRLTPSRPLRLSFPLNSMENIPSSSSSSVSILARLRIVCGTSWIGFWVSRLSTTVPFGFYIGPYLSRLQLSLFLSLLDRFLRHDWRFLNPWIIFFVSEPNYDPGPGGKHTLRYLPISSLRGGFLGLFLAVSGYVLC